MFVDLLYYQKWVLALLNILKYNAAGGDSVLFGVEPWYFYGVNAFLNFNVVFVLYLVAFPVCSQFAFFISFQTNCSNS